MLLVVAVPVRVRKLEARVVDANVVEAEVLEVEVGEVEVCVVDEIVVDEIVVDVLVVPLLVVVADVEDSDVVEVVHSPQVLSQKPLLSHVGQNRMSQRMAVSSHSASPQRFTE